MADAPEDSRHDRARTREKVEDLENDVSRLDTSFRGDHDELVRLRGKVESAEKDIIRLTERADKAEAEGSKRMWAVLLMFVGSVASAIGGILMARGGK